MMERKFLEVGVGVGKKQQQNKKEKAKDKSEVGPEEDTQALRGGERRHDGSAGDVKLMDQRPTEDQDDDDDWPEFRYNWDLIRKRFLKTLQSMRSQLCL